MAKAKRITGCGILLLYKNAADKYRVFLIKEKRGLYNDIGGGMDSGEKELDTVKREIQEESRGLFNIDEIAHELYYVDIEKQDNKFYRSYCVVLDMTDEDAKTITDKYVENMKIIDADKDKKYKTTWKETIDMHSFDVETLLKHDGKGVKYLDNEKHFYIIGERPAHALFAIFNDKKMFNEITSKKYKLNYEENKVKNGISIKN